MQRLVRLASLSTVLGIMLGCSGGGGGNHPPTKPVNVTVTYKGQPVADATVTFINQEGEAAPSFGKTDAQGVAKMRTQWGEGAVLGQHKVTITKVESSGGGSTVLQDSKDYVPPPEGGTAVAKTKSLIPEKYGLVGSSGLTAEVKKDGKNEIPFDLKD